MVSSKVATWTWRTFVCVTLLLLLGATFARRDRRSPVIDAQSGVLPSASRLGGSDVVIFVLDSPIDPAFVLGRMLEVRKGTVSHGSLVGRVLRRYCRVPVVGLTAESLAGATDQKSYRRSLSLVRQFCRESPDKHVLVNISLGTKEASPAERRLLGELRSCGATVIAAAGNDNKNREVFPAAYPTTFAVASASARGKALHSNYGSWIDIAASGDITFVDEEFLPYERVRREMISRGTSFAAPRVTAALAWILQRRTELSEEQAWRALEQTAQPIPDEYYRDGLLGAGYLDIYQLKTTVRPAYRWIHYGVPSIFFGAVAVGTILVIWRLGMAGVFVGLLIWLVALPAGIGLGIMLRTYFECMQAGYQATGPWPMALVLATYVLAAACMRFESGAQLRGLGPGAVLAVTLRVGGVATFNRSILVTAILLVGTLAVEWTLRRWIGSLMHVPEQHPPAEAAEELARVHDESWSERVQAAARRALEKLPREEVLKHYDDLPAGSEKRRALGHLLDATG